MFIIQVKSLLSSSIFEKTKIKFKLPKKDYKESGKYPIVSQEASLISGYHDDISYIFKVAKPIVVFGDHTQALKYVDFDLKLLNVSTYMGFFG